jgi:adenine nucleotide transporter 17
MQLKQKHKISTYEALRKIINDEGIAGLYKGLGSKLAQSVLTAAILFWAKESLVDVTREALIFIMSLSTLMKAKKLSQ